MILVSINREQKTITLTSLMRDMCLVWPEYVDTKGVKHNGNNRINMAYNMGYHWTGNKQDSMDVLESIVRYNFGIPVERTVEIDFDIFMKVVDLLDGVTVDFSQEEMSHLVGIAQQQQGPVNEQAFADCVAIIRSQHQASSVNSEEDLLALRSRLKERKGIKE